MKESSPERIRNFAIVAHIDHGKSTLADRLLEYTHTIEELKEKQVLDSMPLERERGITIKAHPVTMFHSFEGEEYMLNLIDTPGHVDFSYEVSRSLAATEGIVLLVDVSQGVEAQTVAHFNTAKSLNKVIIPVINKIDLAYADLEKCLRELQNLGIDLNNLLLTSGKENIGVPELIERIIKDIPPPKGKRDAPLRALIFDAWYDPYKGVVIAIKIEEGRIKENTRITFFSSLNHYEVKELGIFQLKLLPRSELCGGEVGYLTANIKDIEEVKVGDTITSYPKPEGVEPLPGYKEVKPMVFCSFYPRFNKDFHLLDKALNKLKLNDAALKIKEENSPALGPGFHCGFLGLLHAEITQERLEREYGVEVIATVPQVNYLIKWAHSKKAKNKEEFISQPSQFPDDISLIDSIKEPYVRSIITTPSRYLGKILDLLKEKRGIKEKIDYIEGANGLYTDKVILIYLIPLAEIIGDFYTKLKSYSSGYASFDYQFADYREVELRKVNILIMGVKVEALNFLALPERAYSQAKKLCEKLKKIIPRQQFPVVIQAALGKKVIARETIPAFRKDVTAKCYGGDVTRKRKLLEKQKEGKKRLKKIGKIELPQEAFQAILSI